MEVHYLEKGLVLGLPCAPGRPRPNEKLIPHPPLFPPPLSLLTDAFLNNIEGKWHPFLSEGTGSTLALHFSLRAHIPGKDNKHHRLYEMASYLNSYCLPFRAFANHSRLIGLSSLRLMGVFHFSICAPLLSKLSSDDEEGKFTL